MGLLQLRDGYEPQRLDHRRELLEVAYVSRTPSGGTVPVHELESPPADSAVVAPVAQVDQTGICRPGTAADATSGRTAAIRGQRARLVERVRRLVRALATTQEVTEVGNAHDRPRYR